MVTTMITMTMTMTIMGGAGERRCNHTSSELFSAIPRPKIVVSVVGGELHGFARDASAEGKMQRVARVPTVVAHV